MESPGASGRFARSISHGRRAAVNGRMPATAPAARWLQRDRAVSRPISELAERLWSGAVPPGQLWKPTGQVEEMADGVFFLHTFANMTVDAAPVVAAIYTHGHADHALGLPPFLAEARERGRPRPRIVGHRNVAARFARYRRTHGYNALINALQFGIAPTWPQDYDAP